MSALPMTLPEDVEGEYNHLKRAELMMYIPKDWPTDDESFKDENNYWPVRLMKQLAKFPHQLNTWLGYGHTIPNTGSYLPYADNTGLNGVALSMVSDDRSTMNTEDGTQINLYSLVPLYKEEMDYKLENGADALFDKLEDEIEEGGYLLEVEKKYM